MGFKSAFVAPKSASKDRIAETPLDSIPQEIREHVEEAYKVLQNQPGAIRVDFDSKQEADQGLAQMKAYSLIRPGGKIKFHKSPVNLGATSFQYTVKDFPPEDPSTAEIREAVENVKNAK